ncbi:MAG: hypothetical protein HUJ85_04540 [Veillonella sp.]|nr:hypothetical protein [Veillonella sp.]
MVMTHYMQLLAQNAPWNLIWFMVIPMGVGEILVATEFFNLFYGMKNETWKKWNKGLSIFLAAYYLMVTVYVAFFLVPMIDEWRTWIDIVAIWAYIVAVFPIFGILLMELGFLGKGLDERMKAKKHAIYLVVFLILGHVAMIFGMTPPTLAGYQPKAPMQMNGMQMNGQETPMNHEQMPMTDQEMKDMHHDMMDHGNMDHSPMNHDTMNHKAE